MNRLCTEIKGNIRWVWVAVVVGGLTFFVSANRLAAIGPAEGKSGDPLPIFQGVVSPSLAGAPTQTPAPLNPQRQQMSEKLYITVLRPETRSIISAETALSTVAKESPGAGQKAQRTNIYLAQRKDFLAGGMAVPSAGPSGAAPDQPLWIVSFQGAPGPGGDTSQIAEYDWYLDAVTGKVLGSGTKRLIDGPAGVGKGGMARFDPPGLPSLALPTPNPPRSSQTTEPARPMLLALTDAEKKVAVGVALREPALQKDLAQEPHEVRMTYGQLVPVYGRVASVALYLKDSAVYYDLAVDLSNQKVISKITPLITAPGERVALTPEEEKLARDIAYASALLKEKTAGKNLQGDFVVGYLNDKKEKMAVVVIYTDRALAYHPIVDLTRGQMVSQALKEIVTFPKPSPGPPPGLTPTPPRTDRAPTPTPPPLPAIPRTAPAK